jgi:nucleotide-binding universal stress UspA family protein
VRIKELLVHLDDSAAVETRLDLSILYAQKHEAKLRGLYTITTDGYKESRDIGMNANINRVETIFKAKAAKAGIESEYELYDLSVIGVSVTDILIQHAYYSDLVIVGQINSRDPGNKIPRDFIERLVTAVGRPVMIVPYAGLFKTAGERILIAWKTGRGTVRSLHDAMPHIEKSNYVSVVGVSEGEKPPATESHFISIRKYLASHSVDALTDHICTGKLLIGDEILNFVYEQKADLLIMGACAPTFWKSQSFSHITQHVLKHLTVPVLLSH